MGWYLDKNTVKINSGAALDLYNCGGIIYNGKLVFNPDHMEHMDYVCQPKVLAVLKKHKVRGDICFSSNEGDNKGQKWGYHFDGEGGMTKLKWVKRKWEKVTSKKAKSAQH